jgi:hypothetical protein
MCGRNQCPHCHEELIHRDNRKPWESSSPLGQLLYREGPQWMTGGDIDHFTYLRIKGEKGKERVLLRLVEHKQPQQSFQFDDEGKERPQYRALQEFSLALEEAVKARPDHFDNRSGVFLLQGPIGSNPEGLRETRLGGPQTLSKFFRGRLRFAKLLEDKEELFRWLEALRPGQKPGKRRNGWLPSTVEEAIPLQL